MKKAELVGAIEQGKMLFVGRVVFQKKDVVAYRDKRTGQPATFNKLEFSVVGANGVVFVQPDTRKIPNFKMETYQPPFKIGDMVVVEVESMIQEKGQTTVTGNVEPLVA